jgi:hypothetical protein
MPKISAAQAQTMLNTMATMQEEHNLLVHVG